MQQDCMPVLLEAASWKRRITNLFFFFFASRLSPIASSSIVMAPIRSLFTVLFIVAVLVCCSCIAVAQHPDLITSLPGAPQVNFNQYSGHLVVNSTTQKNLFYWFVESQSNPSKDPLVVRVFPLLSLYYRSHKANIYSRYHSYAYHSMRLICMNIVVDQWRPRMLVSLCNGDVCLKHKD